MKRAKNAKAEIMMMVIFLPLNRKCLVIEFLTRSLLSLRTNSITESQNKFGTDNIMD